MDFVTLQSLGAALGVDVPHPAALLPLRAAARLLGVSYCKARKMLHQGDLLGPVGLPLRVSAQSVLDALQPRNEKPPVVVPRVVVRRKGKSRVEGGFKFLPPD